MGSKKLKRRKLKWKKMEKVRKLKAVKRIKSGVLRGNDEKDFERSLHTKNSNCNRSSKSNCSLSYDESEDVAEVKNFSKIREDYFLYLQTVICDNCAFYDSVVTTETLKNLALELEQNALLACLQVDIYKKSMCKIIRDIKKSTEEKQVHEEVRKLLPESVQEKSDSIKSEKSALNIPELEGYSKIPTIDSIRTDKDLINSTNFWIEESSYNSDYYLVSDQEIYNENQNVISIAQPWPENKTYSSVVDYSGYWNTEVTQTNQSCTNEPDNTEIISSQSSASQNNISDLNQKDNVSPKDLSQSEVKCEKVDPLLLSRSNLQKLVEQTLNETEKIQKQKRDEQERAYIAQILEGDDSLDDRLNDSLSDNENESKENIDETNLMDRLEKMRELFGVEEEEEKSKDVVIEKPKPNTKANCMNSHSHRSNPWRYEKFIQLYKYSLISGEMSCERQNVNRKIFLEIFGEDSDEEHITEYLSEEKYRTSCVERISSWVVKYLMPFYHDKRIIGRNVFKALGHHISDTIVDAIQYPDEWTVKYFVSKFFPPKKKYACDADVLNFQLD